MNRFILLLICALPFLAACSSVRDSGDLQTAPSSVSSYPGLAPSAPPPPVVEPKQLSASPLLEIWQDGYWAYNGREFRWVPGKLVPRPYPTAAWSPDRWEKRTYGWAFVSGHWF